MRPDRGERPRAVRDIHEDGSATWSPSDVDRFADRLHLLAGDANFGRLGKAGQPGQRQFDIERTARAMSSLAELVARA